jgi:hypothetical protein
MPYSFACSCGTKLSVGDNLLGKAVKCPKCATVMKVPAAVGAGASTGVTTPPKSAPAPGVPSTPMPRMELPPSAGKPAPKPAAPKPAAPKAAAPKPPAPAAPKPAPPRAAPKPPPPAAVDDVEVVDDVEEVAAPAPRAGRKGPPPVLAVRQAPPDMEEAPLEEVEDVDDRGDYAGVSRKARDITKAPLDEDFPVPDHMRERIEEELSKGEKVVWVGQPSRRIILIRTIPAMIFTGIFGLLFGGFFFFGAVIAMFKGQASIGAVLIALFILLFLIGIIILQPIYALWKAKRTCYVLTNRRCIVWLCQWHGGIRTDNYTPAQLTNMRRADMWVFGKGGGDVIFRTMTVITTTYRQRGGSSTSVTEYRYGFLAVERCRDVEKLIRETLLDRFLDKLND